MLQGRSGKERKKDGSGGEDGVMQTVVQYVMILLFLTGMVFVMGISRKPREVHVKAPLTRNAQEQAGTIALMGLIGGRMPATTPRQEPHPAVNLTSAGSALRTICESLPPRPLWVGNWRGTGMGTFGPGRRASDTPVVLRVIHGVEPALVAAHDAFVRSFAASPSPGGAESRGASVQGSAGGRSAGERSAGDGSREWFGGDFRRRGAAPVPPVPGVITPGDLDRWLTALHGEVAPRCERYSLSEVRQRRVDGPLGYVAVFNPGRGTKKRVARNDTPRHVVAAFDPSAFSFAWEAPQREVLFTYESFGSVHDVKAVKWERRERGRGGAAGESHAVTVAFCDHADPREAEAAVYVNVAPIDARHVVVVPRPQERATQVLSRRAALVAVRLQRELSSPRFAVGFNGFGAWASVNHGHLQGYDLDPRLSKDGTWPIERAPGDPVRPSIGFAGAHPSVEIRRVAAARRYPVAALHFSTAGRGDRHLRELAAAVSECARYLDARDIAHNALFLRGGTDAYLFPRATGRHRDDDENFHPGYPELAGHVIAKKESFYDTMKEEDVTVRLARENLPEPVLRDIWKQCT